MTDEERGLSVRFRRSESIAELSAALAKAQASLTMPHKDKTNTFFNGSKYADLAAHLNVILPCFSANGLAVMQFPGSSPSGVDVETLVSHSSGQWISCTLAVPVAKRDAQGIGSAITYARRYTISAIAGTAGDDDDGNAAVRHDLNANLNAKKEVPMPTARPNVQANNALTMPWVVILDKMRADGKLNAESLFAAWGDVPKNLGDEERKQLWRLWKSVGEANGFPWNNDLKCFAGPTNGKAVSADANTSASSEQAESKAESVPSNAPAATTSEAVSEPVTSNIDTTNAALKAWCRVLDSRKEDGTLNADTLLKVWMEVPKDMNKAERMTLWDVFCDVGRREGYPWDSKKRKFVEEAE